MTTNNFTLEELEKIHLTFAGNIALKARAQIEALKPRTVRIGEFDVPAPVREKLEYDTKFYVPSSKYRTGYETYLWADIDAHYNFLAAGQIHLTARAAQLHNEALVSFTKFGSD